MWQQLLEQIKKGDMRALARAVSFVENEQEGYHELMENLPVHQAPVIGITGPPGAGKSTLVNGLIQYLAAAGKKLAVLCIDPSSPFHHGAVLGDRIRMSSAYNHPGVFIRSLATRGALGGLHPHILEITELLSSAAFDFIIIETVGVGQSEVEIAGLADVTMVVLVPEAGDEVQTMKSGLMEIADIFVVNKSDRPGADAFIKNLRLMLAPSFTSHHEVAVVKTVASENKGLEELMRAVEKVLSSNHENEKRAWLLAERTWKIVQEYRMKDLDKDELVKKIRKISREDFNLYRFARQFF